MYIHIVVTRDNIREVIDKILNNIKIFKIDIDYLLDIIIIIVDIINKNKRKLLDLLYIQN